MTGQLVKAVDEVLLNRFNLPTLDDHRQYQVMAPPTQGSKRELVVAQKMFDSPDTDRGHCSRCSPFTDWVICRIKPGRKQQRRSRQVFLQPSPELGKQIAHLEDDPFPLERNSSHPQPTRVRWVSETVHAKRDMPAHRLKDHDVDWIQRMLKRIVQQGRKRRQDREAYPLGTLRIWSRRERSWRTVSASG